MTRISPCSIGFTLGVLSLAACGETPSEPQVAEPRSDASSLTRVSDIWSMRANTLARRALPAVGTVTNAAGPSIVYAIGGFTPDGVASNTVQAYNVATNTWTYKAPLPVRVYTTNGVGVIHGKLYISGGLTGLGLARKFLYRYDPAKDTWTQRSSMPSRGHHGLTGVINGQLYVLTGCGFSGGNEDCGEPLVALAFYRYDPVTNRWTTLAPPTNAHIAGAGAVIGGKFYVTGGNNISRLEVYDPATNAWTTKASMPQARWFAAGLAFHSNLYVIGGAQWNADGSQVLVGTTSVYDPARDTWTSRRAPIPDPRANITGTRVVFNGESRIEVVGGDRPNNLQYIP
jgi:N-acetylneuraminic acid mutarotase